MLQNIAAIEFSNIPLFQLTPYLVAKFCYIFIPEGFINKITFIQRLHEYHSIPPSRISSNRQLHSFN